MPPASLPLMVAAMRRRPYLYLVGAVILLIFYLQSPFSRTTHTGPLEPISLKVPAHTRRPGDFVDIGPLELPRRIEEEVVPQRIDLNVAVLEHAKFHDEVIGAVLKTLDDIGVKYTVYRDGWRWGFENILNAFLPKPAPLKYRGEFGWNADANNFDVVIHVSCDHGWRDRMPDYVANNLDQKKDLHVICIYHEMERLANTDRSDWTPAVHQGRFEFMTLSTHTSKYLSRIVQKWAQELVDPQWAEIKVDTLVPIFPLEPEKLPFGENSVVPVAPPRPKGYVPSRIAILGNVQPYRRNYQGVINDLHKAITADPTAWGYLQPATLDSPLVPSNEVNVTPLTLHFVGSKEDHVRLDVPKVIEPLIHIHSNLDYDDFYRLIASMDLIVPAFLEHVYVDMKLSSAIPAAIVSKVPILGTPLLLDSYAFLRPPAIVLHPSGMTEIEAIRLLRLGQDPMSKLPSAPPLLPHYPSWKQDDGGVFGTDAEWREYHEVLYSNNERMMRKLLGRMQQERLDRGWEIGKPLDP